MDQLLFHPKVVHLPMALAVLMPLIAGGVLFAWWRGWLDRRTWVGVVLLQAILVGSAAVAMNTGEKEEDRVEEIVAHRQIAPKRILERFAYFDRDEFGRLERTVLTELELPHEANVTPCLSRK